MRAIEIDQFGGPEVIRVKDVADPGEPGTDQVRIRVAASSVNPVDNVLRQGKLRFVAGGRPPMRLGLDFAGTVEAAGDESGWSAGDEVYGFLSAAKQTGAWAEQLVTQGSYAGPKPGSLSMEESAGLALCGLTALQALRDRAGMKEEVPRRLLVNGASGGVGHLAVQIGRRLGASHVVGTASGQHLDLLRELGCDEAIDYRQEDVTRRTDGFDVILDAAARSTLAACRSALSKQGVYLTTRPGAQNMAEFTGTRVANLIGYGKRATFVVVKPDRKDLALLSRWADEHGLRPRVAAVHPLDQARQAVEALEAGGSAGKQAITIH